MKRAILAIAVLAVCARPVTAQMSSSQCHLIARGVNNDFPSTMTDAQVAEMITNSAPGLLAPISAHTHVDSAGATITGPTRVPFSVTLRHAAGAIVAIYPGVWQSELFNGKGYPDRSSIIWDGGGQTFLPADPTGDPAGDRTWSGSFVLTPPIDHGQFAAMVTVHTQFANGMSGITYAIRTFYSNVDPSAPEYTGAIAYGREFERTVCMFSQIHETKPDGSDLLVDAGEQTVDLGALPKVITAPFTGLVAGIKGYANQQLAQNSINEQRVDADFHHGVQGRTLVSVPGDVTDANEVNFPVQLDPAVLGPGPHKVQIIRWQASPMNTNQWASLLVFPVTVGDSTTPPPPATWQPFLPSFQRLGDQIRVCGTDGKCLVLGSVQ